MCAAETRVKILGNRENHKSLLNMPVIKGSCFFFMEIVSVKCVKSDACTVCVSSNSADV